MKSAGGDSLARPARQSGDRHLDAEDEAIEGVAVERKSVR
jgi:hypothetical protein